MGDNTCNLLMFILSRTWKNTEGQCTGQSGQDPHQITKLSLPVSTDTIVMVSAPPLDRRNMSHENNPCTFEESHFWLHHAPFPATLPCFPASCHLKLKCSADPTLQRIFLKQFWPVAVGSVLFYRGSQLPSHSCLFSQEEISWWFFMWFPALFPL